MSRVDAYLDALDGALRSVGDFRPWPFRIEEVGPYFTDVEAVDLHARLRQLSADGISDVELGRLFPGANSIKTLLMDLVCGMKKAGIPARERVWLTERMFDAMAALETGDIFCRDGTHRLLRSEQAQELFESSTWRWVDGADARSYAKAAYRASASGQALVWALYFYAWTDMGWEVHGPYEVRLPDGTAALLLVRDYFDLAPSLLWPEIDDTRARSMRFMTLHDVAPGIQFDVLNHVQYAGSLQDASRAVHLSVDGVAAGGTEAAAAVARRLLDAARSQNRAAGALTRNQLLRKFVDSRYYAFRRWRTHFGDDWRPPMEIQQRIDQWSPIQLTAAEDPNFELLRQAFDPRSEVLN